jgi:type II secretory pathway pseudopilin PulG
MPRRAFTLIEAVLILAVMALLAAGVTVSLAGAGRVASADDVADAYAAFDRTTREAARRLGRTPELRFDLNRGTVRRADGERDPAGLVLRGDFRVTRVVMRGDDLRSGEVAVPVSARGQTPSYAVLLAGPAGHRWVVFAGLTGQAIRVQDERDVFDILSAATTTGSSGTSADAG